MHPLLWKDVDRPGGRGRYGGDKDGVRPVVVFLDDKRRNERVLDFDEGNRERFAFLPARDAASGATQKSQSCETAQSPTYSATPVLRAGLTEVWSTGRLIR